MSLEEVKVHLSLDTSGFTRALQAASEVLTRSFHRFAHPNRQARCRICNPRNNPPSSPWAADYRRKTRRRNQR